MKLPELNIPDGLEQAFFNVVQFLGGKSGDVYISHKTKPARKYYSYIAFRSLFVKWQDLWNSFSESRKKGWTNYWATLPFGGHWGAGGFPGSGFSAFVYVNAPRYKLGQALLLDPPIYPPPGTELLKNGSFTGSAQYWFLQYGWSYDNNQIRIVENQSGQNSIVNQNPVLLQHAHTYRLNFDLNLKKQETGLYTYCKIQIGDNPDIQYTYALFPFINKGWKNVTIDLTASVIYNISDNVRLKFTFYQLDNYYSEYSYLDNISLKEL